MNFHVSITTANYWSTYIFFEVSNLPIFFSTRKTGSDEKFYDTESSFSFRPGSIIILPL